MIASFFAGINETHSVTRSVTRSPSINSLLGPGHSVITSYISGPNTLKIATSSVPFNVASELGMMASRNLVMKRSETKRNEMYMLAITAHKPRKGKD